MMSLRLPPFIALRGAALVFLAVLSAASGGPAFTQINGPVNAQAPAQQAPAAQTEVEAMPAGGHAVLAEVVAAITKRCQGYIARLTDSHPASEEPDSESP